MRVTRLSRSDYRRMPWKNGLGVTTEIARQPAEGDFDWRVSAAEVTTAGPFSLFPGCDRVILTVEGAGMVLTHAEPQTQVSIGLLEPWAFSGDWTTECTLIDGPIRDFNVIARRTSWRPRVTVLRVEGQRSVALRGDAVLLYCAVGSVVVDDVALERDETLMVDRTGGALTFAVRAGSEGLPAAVVAVELSRASP